MFNRKKLKQRTRKLAVVREMLHDAYDIIKASTDARDMLESDGYPSESDPRYMPIIGEWNGTDAPQVRYQQFLHQRNERERKFKTKYECSSDTTDAYDID